MTFHRRLLILVGVAVLGLAPLGLAAAAHADEPTFTVPANANDPGISTARGENLIWLADPGRRVGKLLVFLPTGGATNLPTEFKHLGTEMGRLGYHTIILAYRNEAPIAALPTDVPPGCGRDELPSELPSPSPTCASDARTEILTGSPKSTVVNVDRANSIENRLNKLLVHLVATRPAAEKWEKYIDDSGSEPQPKWSETVIAGSSLGAGQAAMIAAKHNVYRAALLHGWVDARHGWVTLDATPSSKYFTLIHQRENFFGRTCYAYLALGLTTSCPLAQFPIVPAPSCPDTFPEIPDNPLWFENLQPPYGAQLNVFSLEPGSFEGTGDNCHQSTSRDRWLAKGSDRVILVSAWRSVLGDSDADSYLDPADPLDPAGPLDHADNCPSTPNPDQADTDGDGVGDDCFPFAGFFAPVNNGTMLNLVKAGSAVPVKFSLGGDRGLEVLAVGSPSSRPISCDAQAPLDVVEETVSPGASTLSYDALADSYQYVWKTDAAWSGTCRQLAVRTVDGATHPASFKLK